ncbi:MAG: hypothetical protein LBI81_03235 [Puniceicoccales bacterium]|nr:hypothetical protein [Puniceicoccales bacterium]
MAPLGVLYRFRKEPFITKYSERSECGNFPKEMVKILSGCRWSIRSPNFLQTTRAGINLIILAMPSIAFLIL